jgi:hypothetical protein
MVEFFSITVCLQTPFAAECNGQLVSALYYEKEYRVKKIIAVTLMVLVTVVGLAVAVENGKLNLKSGDSVSACNCGDKCGCRTMANTEANCSCGNKMLKAAMVKVDGDKAKLKAAGWDKERAFPTKGKYACVCENCNCGMISRNPGKCGCGSEMKKI